MTDTDWNGRLLDLYDSDPSLVAKDQLAEALRAALATRPEPDPPNHYSRAERLAWRMGYAAGAAGSATPTGDDDD
jgi:hypothetical protein